jgi:diguanylate cyclase (GGDEF)-like protein
VTEWTRVLSDVALAEFVLLAALSAWQWVRHRIRGAGWVALTFAVVAGLFLALRIDPSLSSSQDAARSLVALLAVTPYCLFRFAATFRRPRRSLRFAAAGATVGIVAFTVALPSLPFHGHAAPPAYPAYRIVLTLAFGFLLSYVALRFVLAGRGQPPVAATRMRLLALAVAGVELQVLVVAFGLHGPVVDLVTRVLAVVIGGLFLAALAAPSSLSVLVGRREDDAFRRAVVELVSASDARDVGRRLLPHVCALVGASKAVLLRGDGTIVAAVPAGTTEHPGAHMNVRAQSGSSHELLVSISPFLPYFGRSELQRLDQLADMVGLAIECCDLAERLAFQASHDSLTGLANRGLFMERLDEALHHVGRRRRALAVLFIDLDRFKLVNDRADHATGDLVLNEMARRLTAMTRGVDVVARFGGDEFVALAEVDHERDAIDMSERIRMGLAQPVTIGGAKMVVTASVGLVVVSDTATGAGAVLRDADNAMYDAKRLGRDQVVLCRNNARITAQRRWGLGPTRAVRLNAG